MAKIKIQRRVKRPPPLPLLFVFFFILLQSLSGQTTTSDSSAKKKIWGGLFIFSESLSYDYIDGYMDALISQSNVSFYMGDYINFDTSFRLDLTSGIYRNIQLRYTIKSVPFFHIEMGYIVRDFPQYKIAEHNLVGACHLIIPIQNFLEIRGSFGINTRYVDIDTSDRKSGLNENWLKTNIFIWETSVFFSPHPFYTTGLKIGNLSFNEVISEGYFQFENLNRFCISPSITLLANIGFALAGTGSIAGIPNRFWITGGIKYEVPF